MNSLILNSILSMDAYNRGYNQTIIVSGSQLGDEKIVSDSLILGSVTIDGKLIRNDEKYGLYAIAYTDTFTGKTIISYRGTDDALGLVSGNDFFNGWVGGAGLETTQAGLAFTFYNDVAKTLNNNVAVDPRTANIILTGHSLGGGLAGLVGAVYGKTGYLFDNMPFEQAAKNTQTHSDQLIALAHGTFYDASLKELVYKNYNGGKAWAPTISSTSSTQTYHVEGEILGSLRLAQETHKNPFTLGKDVEIPGVSPVFSTEVARHSMAILVMAMYGDPSNTAGMQTNWQNAGKYFWPVLFDKEFAGEFISAGMVPGTANTSGHYETILQMAIAYSAIDEGPTAARPFGDTGIRAFFNDANELGVAVGTDPKLLSSAIQSYGKEISQSFVQYAGELALNKISLSGTNTAVLNGVLGLNATAHTLSINFSDTTWKAAGLKAEPDGTLSIVSRDDLANKILGELDTGSPARYYMSELWGSESSSLIDRVVFALNDSGSTIFSANAGATPGHAGLLVGGSGSGTLVGSAGDDIIVGGNGTNTLKGNGGTDLVIGGKGDNIFVAGNGRSILQGDINGGVNTLDLSNYAEKITITAGRFSTEGSTAYGNFYAMDKIKLGGGDDTINAAGYAYETVTVNAGDGKDTLSFLGSSNGDVLVAGGAVTLDHGSALDNIGLTRVVNVEKIASEGGLITVRELGHSFEGSKTVYDYSGFVQKLTLTAVTATDGMSVTDGVKTDSIALARGTSGIVGSNLGDTINLSTSATTLWLGYGNDTINLNAGAKGTLIYTGGTDTFNVNNHSFLGTIQLGRDVSNTATFTRTPLAWGLNADGKMQSEFNLTVAIPDAGSMIFNKAGIQYNGAGADGRFFTADDVISYNIHLNIKTWDGLTYDLLKVKPILTGTAIDPGAIPTPYDDNLTSILPESDHAVNGGAGNDTLTADIEDAWMYGGTGHDTLFANSSYDHLYGGFDDDVLYGGSYFTTLSGDDGNDTLYALSGTNNLYGGDGDDAYVLSGGTYNTINDEISPDSGANTIEFKDLTRSQIWYGFIPGTRFVEFHGTDGFYLSLNDYSNFTTAKFSNGEIIDLKSWAGSGYYISDGQDFNDASAATSSVTIHMMAGNDYFKGSAYGDMVYGDAGNDYIWANAGNDIIDGGAGRDTAMFSDDPAGVTVNLALGTAIDGWGNTDTLISIEDAQGTIYNDLLISSSVKNFLVGNGGIDTVSYEAAATGVTINLATGKVTGDGGDTLSAISNAIGSRFNDTFVSSKGDNIFTGNGGIDTVSYTSATAAVTVNLAAGTAIGDGADTLKGISNAIGSTRNDTFISSGGNNVFTGNGGTDTVSYAFAANGVTANLTKGTVTGDGADTLKAISNIIGSAHDDIFVSSIGNNVLNGGAGIDTLSYAGTASAVTVSLALTGAQATGGSGTDTISGVEKLIGSSFNDKLTGSSGNNIIEGGAGNDILNGGAGTDTLSYSSAASAITVSLALTTAQVTGGAGTDTVSAFENLIGSAFNDKLTGSSGNNTIEGGAGNDTLNGGAGTDTLSYASATSAITVSLALTTAQVTGGAGTDTVSAFENLNGSGFNDKLTGNTGVNTIHGGAGVDTIDGGAGNDVLYGDAGADILTGGAGLDRFVFDTSLSGSDTIKDFNKAEDTLDLSNLLTAFDPLTDAITQFVQISNSGANSLMKVDLDGAANGQVWTQIATLTGVTGLTDEQALLNSGHLIG